LDFCKFVLKHDAFVSGKFDTGFIAKYFTPEVLNVKNEEYSEIAAIAGAIIFENSKEKQGALTGETVKKTKWKTNRLN
jgi:acetyl-CoA carboxylase, biotin carboxylase subunit